MIQKRAQAGFTLLEILLALGILTISLLVISDFHNVGMVASRRSEELTIASMLARQQLHVVQLDLEKGMAKEEFPGDSKTTEGTFDEPYEKYKWKAEIKKVEIPVPPAGEGEDAEQNNAMLGVFKMVAEKIGKSAREVKVTVTWDDLGEEQGVSAATHIVKL